MHWSLAWWLNQKNGVTQKIPLELESWLSLGTGGRSPAKDGNQDTIDSEIAASFEPTMRWWCVSDSVAFPAHALTLAARLQKKGSGDKQLAQAGDGWGLKRTAIHHSRIQKWMCLIIGYPKSTTTRQPSHNYPMIWRPQLGVFLTPFPYPVKWMKSLFETFWNQPFVFFCGGPSDIDSRRPFKWKSFRNAKKEGLEKTLKKTSRLFELELTNWQIATDLSMTREGSLALEFWSHDFRDWCVWKWCFFPLTVYHIENGNFIGNLGDFPTRQTQLVVSACTWAQAEHAEHHPTTDSSKSATFLSWTNHMGTLFQEKKHDLLTLSIIHSLEKFPQIFSWRNPQLFGWNRNRHRPPDSGSSPSLESHGDHGGLRRQSHRNLGEPTVQWGRMRVPIPNILWQSHDNPMTSQWQSHETHHFPWSILIPNIQPAKKPALGGFLLAVSVAEASCLPGISWQLEDFYNRGTGWLYFKFLDHLPPKCIKDVGNPGHSGVKTWTHQSIC